MVGELTATTRAWFWNTLVEFCSVENQSVRYVQRRRQEGSDGGRTYRYDEGLVLECSR